MVVFAVSWYALVTLVGFVAAVIYNWIINRVQEEVGSEFIYDGLLVIAGVAGTETIRAIRILPAVYLASARIDTDGATCVAWFIAAWVVDVALSYGITGTPMLAGNLNRARKKRARSRRKMENLKDA